MEKRFTIKALLILTSIVAALILPCLFLAKNLSFESVSEVGMSFQFLLVPVALLLLYSDIICNEKNRKADILFAVVAATYALSKVGITIVMIASRNWPINFPCSYEPVVSTFAVIFYAVASRKIHWATAVGGLLVISSVTILVAEIFGAAATAV